MSGLNKTPPWSPDGMGGARGAGAEPGPGSFHQLMMLSLPAGRKEAAELPGWGWCWPRCRPTRGSQGQRSGCNMAPLAPWFSCNSNNVFVVNSHTSHRLPLPSLLTHSLAPSSHSPRSILPTSAKSESLPA